MTRHCVTFPLLLGAALSACSGAPSPGAQALSSCTVVRDPADRLACFDRAADTPEADVAAALTIKVSPLKPLSASDSADPTSPIVDLVRQIEAGRTVNDRTARARDFGAEGTQGHHLYVSAIPTLGTPPRAWLAISCLETISRLQLVLAEPVPYAQATITLTLDGQPVASEQRWQVLGQGSVIDAGRGLVAIDTLRRLRDGEQLHVISDIPALDGLSFEAAGLSARVAEQRKACRW